jgi:hypothetical protein
LAVAGVLVGVVGFTVINRPPSPVRPSPTIPGVAAVQATPGDSPTPSDTPGPAVSIPPDFTVATRSDQGYEALIDITGGSLHVSMDLVAPELYRAEVVIPTTGLGNKLPIQIAHISSQGGGIISEPFGAWSVPLGRLRRSRHGDVSLLIKRVEPGASGSFSPGYTFAVTGYRTADGFGLILSLVRPVLP